MQKTGNYSQKKGRDFWGPPIWITIHTLAATLKPGDAGAFKTLLWSLTELLPCDFCRTNLAEKLRNHPPDTYLRNKEDAFFYTYILHDMANQHISKYHPDSPKNSPPYDDVKAFYFSVLGEECKDCKT